MSETKVLLVGLGGFGRNHLRAWQEMKIGENLYVAELQTELHAELEIFNIPSDHISTNAADFLDKVDVVDIVTPSTSHFELCSMALKAGKDVFVEKPMTMTSEEATELAKLVKDTQAILQVGFYYRFHPISNLLKTMIDRGDLGEIRYFSGNFMGFKRARTDVGVTHTDGIHFIDLANWLLSALPTELYAVTRDHFSRGLEDCSLVLLQYPGGAFAKVESGYIQPGRWRDKVVPNAVTSKEIFICGTKATVEVDFETEYLVKHNVHQVFSNNTWTPVFEGTETLNSNTATPIQMIVAELRDFLDCVSTRRHPAASEVGSGVVLAKIMESIYESSDTKVPVNFEWSNEEALSLLG